MSDNLRLIALGEFRFSLDKAEYDNLQRNITWRWDKTNIINNRPNYQMAGIDEETITINGAVYNYRANQQTLDSPVNATGTDQISQMRAQGAKGLPLRVALDDGRHLGFWVIQSISEQQTHFVGSAPIKQAYNIRLAYFGDRL